LQSNLDQQKHQARVSLHLGCQRLRVSFLRQGLKTPYYY